LAICLAFNASAQNVVDSSAAANESSESIMSKRLISDAANFAASTEVDANGRLAFVNVKGQKVEVLYDGANKIVGIKRNGQVSKITLAEDLNGQPVIRVIGANGEYEPVQLSKAGFPASLLSAINEDVVNVEKTPIDVKAIKESARARSLTSINQIVAQSSVTRKIFGGDVIYATPQCTADCDRNQQVDENNCDFADNMRMGSCGTLALLAIESGPFAIGVGIVCVALSKGELNTCRNGAANRRYECIVRCG
jgi:hypothetical protein